MMRESKAKIKKDFIGERCNTLQAEITGYKNATVMSNNEVRFALKESRDWKKESSNIVGLQQAYLEGWDAVNNLLYNVNRKVQSLGDEDKRQGLNTRSENKGWDRVIYLGIFPG